MKDQKPMKQLCIYFLSCLLFTTSVNADQLFQIDTNTNLTQGWLGFDNKYIAAFELELSPGWKTYWRAPGDSGIPPEFDFSGSKNLKSIEIIWPRPIPFGPSDLRSIGYKEHLILPIKFSPKNTNKPVELNIQATLGICQDICVPIDIVLTEILDTKSRKPVPKIVAAMVDVPTDKTGKVSVFCDVKPNGKEWSISARLTHPNLGKNETLVIESRHSDHWITTKKIHRAGQTISAEARLRSNTNQPIALARNDLRFTLISETKAIEIRGCQRK